MNATEHELLASLKSGTCPACGDAKKLRQTLCLNCYRGCKRATQKSLYSRLGQGYAEAVEQAFADLDRHVFRLPEPEEAAS